MASVVIIHAADDALPARALGEKLRLAKLTPVIEKSGGDERQGAIKSAAVTIALWSPRSVADAAAVSDTAFAKSKSKLIHASMQSVALPEQFRGEKWVDLTGWRGEDDFPAWLELAKLVADKAGVTLPPPAPRPASGFFQPARVDPNAVAAAEQTGRVGANRPVGAPQPPPQVRTQPRAPQAQPQRSASAPPPPRPQPTSRPMPPRSESESTSGGGGRMMILAAITFVVVALAGGGGYYLWNNSQNSGAAASWEAVDTGDAAALRAFIEDDPGAYRDEAQAALTALEERSFEAAMDANTVEALQAFLTDFPSGDNALAARGRIAELQSAAAPPPAEEGLAPPPGVTPDPDLVPPGAASSPGPVALTPEPTPETPDVAPEPEGVPLQ